MSLRGSSVPVHRLGDKIPESIPGISKMLGGVSHLILSSPYLTLSILSPSLPSPVSLWSASKAEMLCLKICSDRTKCPSIRHSKKYPRSREVLISCDASKRWVYGKYPPAPRHICAHQNTGLQPCVVRGWCFFL